MNHRHFSAGALLLLCTIAPLQAQQAPTIQASGGVFTLTIPYLEATVGADRLAVSARLTSTDLARFALDPASVQNVSPLQNAVRAAQFAAQGAGYRLTVPYLEYADGGSTRAFQAAFSTTDLAVFALDAAAVGEVSVVSNTLAPPLNISVSKVNEQTVGSYQFASSSQ